MIDIKKPETFKTLTLKDLVADAVERNDEVALKWLEAQANTMKTRTRDDKSTYEVRKSIVEIRAEYVKKFLGYETKSAASKKKAQQAKKDKAQKEIDDLFANAFKQLK